MQASQPGARTRQRDSLFGICAAIGEDFGFNPDILRIVLAGALLWNPAVVIGGYAFAGLLTLLNHRVFPRAVPARDAEIPAPVSSAPDARHDEADTFALAA